MAVRGDWLMIHLLLSMVLSCMWQGVDGGLVGGVLFKIITTNAMIDNCDMKFTDTLGVLSRL